MWSIICHMLLNDSNFFIISWQKKLKSPFHHNKLEKMLKDKYKKIYIVTLNENLLLCLTR